MNKQEFIDKVLEIGGGRAIDVDSLPTIEVDGGWYYYVPLHAVVWRIHDRNELGVFILNFDIHNPPERSFDITFFYWPDDYLNEVPDDWAITRINELPFVGEPPEKTCSQLGGEWCPQDQLCEGTDITNQASDRNQHPNQICCIGNCYAEDEMVECNQSTEHFDSECLFLIWCDTDTNDGILDFTDFTFVAAHRHEINDSEYAFFESCYNKNINDVCENCYAKEEVVSYTTMWIFLIVIGVIIAYMLWGKK